MRHIEKYLHTEFYIFCIFIKTQEMRKIIIIAGLLCSYMSTSMHAQTRSINTLRELTGFMQSDYNYVKEQRERNSEIEGSPYLDENFQDGKLSFRGRMYDGLKLRYNMYASQFEFKSEEEILYFDPAYTAVDTVWIGDDEFIYMEYIDDNRNKRKYMQLLNNGKTQVLSLRETILLEAEKPKGYEEGKPARFRQLAERHFVQFPGQPAVEFKNKRSIEDVFPEYEDQLISFAKNNKLKFRSSDDLIELCKYFDTLH